jgi:uncharacterized membrane protein YsdA (DUF1294 family)
MTALGIHIMALDKRRAVRGKRRIPERTLFLIAALGGSLGVLLGMKLMRHKTRHKKFVILIPLILALQTILAAYAALRLS